MENLPLSKVCAEIIKLNPEMPNPSYGTSGSAGLDVYANIEEDQEVYPDETVIIGTGIKIWTGNPNFALIAAPRSGLGVKGMQLKNTIGVIDSDYQGEIKIFVINNNDYYDGGKVIIPSYKSGKPFAQILCIPVMQLLLWHVEEFSNVSERAEDGFGHTDNKL